MWVKTDLDKTQKAEKYYLAMSNALDFELLHITYFGGLPILALQSQD